MRSAIRFNKIMTQADWDELRAFAASFGHTIDDRTRTPLYAIRRGEKLFGYFSVAPFPVLFPCFSEQYTSPRDFIDAVENIRSWQWLMTSGNDRYPRGICLVGANTNAETSRAIERLGFSKVATLWESAG